MFIGVVRRFQFDTFPWNGLIDVVRAKRLTRSGAQVLRMYSAPKVLRRSKNLLYLFLLEVVLLRNKVCCCFAVRFQRWRPWC